MRPIRFNLLAEEQLAEERSARDPVKVAVAIGIGLITLAILVGTMISFQVSHLQKTAFALQSKWKKLSTPEVLRDREEMHTAKSLAEDLKMIGNKRPLYAPQLAILKDVMPDTIRLVRIVYVLAVESQLEAPPIPDISAKPRARRSNIRQYLTLQLEGRATSARPEIEVDNFIQTLKTDPLLTNLIAGVHLRSISRLSKSGQGGANPSDDTPQAAFVIDCQYKDLK